MGDYVRDSTLKKRLKSSIYRVGLKMVVRGRTLFVLPLGAQTLVSLQLAYTYKFNLSRAVLFILKQVTSG